MIQVDSVGYIRIERDTKCVTLKYNEQDTMYIYGRVKVDTEEEARW